MDYEPSTQVSTDFHRILLESLNLLQGRSVRDSFTLAQIQALIEDAVWQFSPTGSVALDYVDDVSLVAVYRVDGMGIDRVRVQTATPDVRVMISYKMTTTRS